MKVFLGGTCSNSTWRDELIPLLRINYFNPVVSDWNEESRNIEIRERETSDYCLYVISPRMDGVYSIAEAIDDSNKRPCSVIFCFLYADNGYKFNVHQIKSLEATSRLITKNGGRCLNDIISIANFLNSKGRYE